MISSILKNKLQNSYHLTSIIVSTFAITSISYLAGRVVNTYCFKKTPFGYDFDTDNDLAQIKKIPLDFVISMVACVATAVLSGLVISSCMTMIKKPFYGKQISFSNSAQWWLTTAPLVGLVTSFFTTSLITDLVVEFNK